MERPIKTESERILELELCFFLEIKDMSYES